MAHASVGGLNVMAFDSFMPHAFNFTPAMSIYLSLPDEKTVEDVAKQLGEGGKEMMLLGEYDFSKKYAWLEDRFGVSWQIAIAP